MENSSQGLTLLDPDRKVVVTGEEHHQPALSGYAPGADGRPRRVAVELTRTPAGRIEVLLDGWRVGELTALMSQRYGGHVDAVLRRGGRPGAVGLVVDGRRGVEVELRLPEAFSEETVDTTSPLPPVLPRPTPRGPAVPPARPRRRFRKPLLIGGGVFALLVVIGAVAGGEGEIRDTATPAVSASVPAARPAPTTTAPTTTTSRPTVAPDPTLDADRDAARGAAAPAPRQSETRTPDPEPVREATPEPRRPAPAPGPEPEPEPEPEPSGSSTSYPNCSAVRAAGAAPIRAGEPGYSRKLDRDGDGVGCDT